MRETIGGNVSGRSHLMVGRGLREVDGTHSLEEDVMKGHLVALTLSAALAMPAFAADQVEKAPPSGAYKKVSELVKLPDFLPVWARSMLIRRRSRPAPSWPMTATAGWSAPST